MKKAIFLDKDGTLIHDIPYNVKPDLIRFTHGAMKGLIKLAKANYKFFIISNQQGIALKYFTVEELLVVKKKIEGEFTRNEICLNGFYFCPHHKNDFCLCRKPQPGMLLKASVDYGINLSESWMIGDTPADIEAGKRAGCRTVLFDKGYENNWDFNGINYPHYIVNSLNQAADYIMKEKIRYQNIERIQ